MNEVPANVLAEYDRMTSKAKCFILSFLEWGYSPQVISYAANQIAKEQDHLKRTQRHRQQHEV